MKIKNLLDDNKTTQPEEPKVLPVHFIQPWSNMICKFKLPDPVFEKLLELYDYTTNGRIKSFGDQLVGQIENEPEVTPEILDKFPEWADWCLQSTRQFVRTSMSQVLAGDNSKRQLDDFLKQDIMTRIATMWFVNQKPGEYNPAHIHTNCKISSVVYLKTPKNQVKGRKDHYQADGQITFMNNTGTDMTFANAQCSFEPKPGEMYVFPALQHHMVWPYRSSDPDDLRVSLSFNADFTTQQALEIEKKNQEKLYEEMKKHKESEVKNDKGTDVSDINKSG